MVRLNYIAHFCLILFKSTIKEMLKAQKPIRITHKSYLNDFAGDSDHSLADSEELEVPNKPSIFERNFELPKASQRLSQSMTI